MGKNFWTGLAVGALTGLGAGLAASNSYCGCGYSNYSFNSFSSNSFGLFSFNMGNPFSLFGFGFGGCCNRYVGETPFESFGYSNSAMASLPLGHFIV